MERELQGQRGGGGGEKKGNEGQTGKKAG